MLDFTFFIGKIHNSLKSVVAIAMGIASILSFAGVLCSCAPGILAYLVGGILAAGTLYLLFDVYSQRLVRAAVEQFKEQIGRLNDSVDHLEVVRDQLQEQTDSMRVETDRYKSENRTLAARNQEFKSLNIQLAESSAAFASERSQLHKEISSLGTETNELKKANTGLLLVQENAKKLINSLMLSGDKFNNFGEILRDSLDQLDDTNVSMERLLTNLKRASFSDIDDNHDGAITRDELDAWVARRAEGAAGPRINLQDSSGHLKPF